MLPLRISIFCLLFVIFPFSFGQTNANVPQEKKEAQLNLNQHFILQYKLAVNYNQIKAYCDSLLVPYQIKNIEQNWRLVQLSIPEDTQYGTFGMVVIPLKFKILEKLRNSNMFDLVQLSHTVSKRRVPNDQYLSKQYHLAVTKNYNVWEN